MEPRAGGVVQCRATHLDDVGDEEQGAGGRLLRRSKCGTWGRMRVAMAAVLGHGRCVAAAGERPELGLTRAGIHGGYWRVPHDIRTTLLYTGIVGIPQAYAPDIRFR